MNLSFQPLQYLGRSGGSRPYRKKRASRHSCTPSSVPFTVDGCTVSQAPVFVARRIPRALSTGGPASVAVSASSACCWLCLKTAVRPSRRQAECSAVRNSTWNLSSAMRCHLMKKDAVQFLGAVWVGYGRANTACFTGREISAWYEFQDH